MGNGFNIGINDKCCHINIDGSHHCAYNKAPTQPGDNCDISVWCGGVDGRSADDSPYWREKCTKIMGNFCADYASIPWVGTNQLCQHDSTKMKYKKTDGTWDGFCKNSGEECTLQGTS